MPSIGFDIYSTVQNKYQTVSTKNKLNDLIDKFIGITNLLHMVENQQIINEFDKKYRVGVPTPSRKSNITRILEACKIL